MKKIRSQLSDNGFTFDQIAEMEAGAQAGVDVPGVWMIGSLYRRKIDFFLAF